MSNRVCPKCGEEYSDTYKKCPFCEEEEAIRKGKPIRRRGGKRLSKKKRSAGAGGVMLSVVGVVLICVVAFVLWGDQLVGMMGIRVNDDPEVREPVHTEEPDVPAVPDDGGEEVVEPADPADPTEPAEPVDPAVPAEPLALDFTSLSIPAGETALITATGGNGKVTWKSSNEHIATVKDGSVSGKAGGVVTITATSGQENVTCQLTVTGDPWVSDAKLTLNKTDFTLRRNDPPVQMKVKGTESPAVWSSKNPNVASVSESGVVKWAGKGTTTITASVDGHVLECIVRCAG